MQRAIGRLAIQSGARAFLFGAALLGAPAQAAPSTFSTVIGSAILCRSHLDNAYFYRYLTAAFGAPYKREGGAYWFRADGSLWGATVTDVLLSDDSSAVVFVGALAESTPEALNSAVRSAMGVSHYKIEKGQFGMLEASPGSRIVYANTKAKIYCAKFKPLPGR